MGEQSPHLDHGQAGASRKSQPYGDHAAPAFEQGYVPVAIPRGEKGPKFSGWQMRRHPSSLTISERAALTVDGGTVLSDDLIEAEATASSESNMGIVLGHTLIAIDVDLHDEVQVEQMRNLCKELGWWSVVRVGSKGFCLLVRNGWVDGDGRQILTGWNATWGYRADEYARLGGKAPKQIEILTGPRQVVWSPSIHPTGATYCQTGPDSLFNTDIADLPMVDAKALNKFCARAGELLNLVWVKSGGDAQATQPAHQGIASRVIAGTTSAKVAHAPITDEQLIQCTDGDLHLLPQSIPVWLAEVNLLRTETRQTQIEPWVSPSGLFRFVATWRESSSATVGYGRTDWNRKKSVSISPWNPQTNPGKLSVGIKDHALPYESGVSTWTAYEFCLRLLTPHDRSVDILRQDTPASNAIRRRIWAALNSLPEIQRQAALLEAAVSQFKMRTN